MSSYKECVRSATRTQFAYPTVYEGELSNGESYRLTYHYGMVTVLNKSARKSITKPFSVPGANCLSHSDFKKLMVELHPKLVAEEA